MFSPIGAYPVGAFAPPAAGYTAASGSFNATGIVTGTVRVAGASATTFALTGSATAQSGRISRPSWLGFGPIGSGSIGEMISVAAPITSMAGAATGTFSVSGSAICRVQIVARAPDIVLTPWSITPGDGAATINTFPLPPTAPGWIASVGVPGFTITSYPNYNSSVPSVPFFDMAGAATASSPRNVIVDGLLEVSGAAAASARANGMASGAIEFPGGGQGATAIRGAGLDLFGITGAATCAIGALPVAGVGSGEIDFSGSGIIQIGHNAYAQTIFSFNGAAQVSVSITAQAVSAFDLAGGAEIKRLSERRSATPENSGNGGRILTEAQVNKLLGR